MALFNKKQVLTQKKPQKPIHSIERRYPEQYGYSGRNADIYNRIQRRRLQLLVNSCIYYEMDNNLVSDRTYDAWGKELAQLQNDYPDISKNVIWADAFDGWDGTTGFHLPIKDPWVMQKARKILNGK